MILSSGEYNRDCTGTAISFCIQENIQSSYRYFGMAAVNNCRKHLEIIVISIITVDCIIGYSSWNCYSSRYVAMPLIDIEYNNECV